MAALVKALSRAVPTLTFVLATLCVDDSDTESYHIRAGVRRKWALPPRRKEFHWNRARVKFALEDDWVYESDDAEHWVDEELLAEALVHWDVSAGRRQSDRPPRRWQWWNRLVLRELAIEKELELYEANATITSETLAGRNTASKRGLTRQS